MERTKQVGERGRERPPTYGDDIEFLKQHTEVVELSDPSGNALVAVAPAYQGRVMTSAAVGKEGLSFGWIGREQIEKFAGGEIDPHLNALGGEDRFWNGPEGGQHAIFFGQPADPSDRSFGFEAWRTPAYIDTEPFDIVDVAGDKSSVTFKKEVRGLPNRSGTKFDIDIERTVRMLGTEDVVAALGVELPGVNVVAFESENRMTNVGPEAWTKEKGLLSMWILGMLRPSPDTTMVIPFNTGSEAELGPVVNDAYFGRVPDDRLVIDDKKGALFFKGDGNHRGKLGLSPQRAKPVLGSYDAANNVLTLVQYNKPEGATDYVDSMWKWQDNPYGGDVVNAYNDGPLESGGQLGPFYELETSSPATELQPNQSISHTHRTVHLQGPEEELDKIAKATLGVGLEEIKSSMRVAGSAPSPGQLPDVGERQF